MSRRTSSSLIDRLIAESKQITCDLMALRHEMERKAEPTITGGWKERVRLIESNLRSMGDTVFALAYGKSEPEPEFPEFEQRPRALGNGQLRLTAGGRG